MALTRAVTTRTATDVHARVGARPNLRPVRTQVVTAVATVVLGTALGIAVALDDTLLVVATTVALGALALTLLRPEALLIAWFAAILVDGRSVTYTQVGPLYVTEPLLALLVCGVLAGILVRVSAHPGFLAPRQRPLRYVVVLNLVMLVPALVGLALMTSTFSYVTGRNLLLVLYPLFAVVVVLVTDLARSWRYWYMAALAGPALALLLVATGLAGDSGTTSTGATRLASYTFILAFGIAPIVTIAAARERLLRPMWAIAGTIPFLVALTLVNHRSAWLAFVAAALVLFGVRLSPAVVVGGLAVAVVGLLVLTAPISESTPLSDEIVRARSVTNTSDPNASFRLAFWEAAMAKSLNSPVFGNGFDAYPDDVAPPQPGNPDPFPSPHNSFVAIAYRAGLISFLIVLGLLLNLVRLGFRASRERTLPVDRAVCAALTGVVVFIGVTSAFNVYLEAPYAGPLFWTCVGLLAYAVYADPFRRKTP
jgi:O-antigen ligase